MLKAIASGMVAAVGLSSAVSAAILSDNFNNGAEGPLLGRVADTGQTWQNMALGSFSPANGGLGMHAVYGTNGTLAAGSGVPDTGSTIPLGQTLSTGLVILDLDFENPQIYNEPQFWLSNAAGTANASLFWNADTRALVWEGLGVSSFSMDTGPDLAAAGGSLHVTLTVDLDAKQFSIDWFDNNDPGDVTSSGSSGPHGYSPTYEPDRLHIYRNASNGNFYSGFDNIVLDIPEPASAALLAIGAGLMVCRRRRQGV